MKLIAFSQALLEFHRDAQKAKVFLNDKRMTHYERDIIHAWYALKQSQNDEALNLVKDIPISQNQMILAQASIIKGIAFNNSGLFKEACHALENAVVLMDPSAPPELRFIPYYNLFIAYFNLSSGADMERTLKALDEIKSPLGRQLICRLQCALNFAVFKESCETPNLIKELDRLLPEMSPPMAMTHLTTVFMYWVKREKFIEAKNILEVIKSHRMFRSTSNFNFMKVLLDHLMSKKPIYINQERFKDSEFLFSQLKVIEALERNELEDAHRYWARLSVLDPGKYEKDFKYLGQKGLFSLCLDFHRPQSLLVEKDKLPADKLEAVAFILQNSPRPISKNQIFSMIYGHEPQNVQDDNRLRNLIFQARKKYGESIKFKKGCYFWEENSKSKKAG